MRGVSGETSPENSAESEAAVSGEKYIFSLLDTVCDSSSQALFRSFRASTKSSLNTLFLLSPKSLSTFRGPRI